jgi:hypothetical protein
MHYPHSGCLELAAQSVLTRGFSGSAEIQSFYIGRSSKEARFKCIILLMYSILDFDKQSSSLGQHRPNLRSRDDVIEELKAEWHNAILFSSNEALKAAHAFIQEPSTAHFRRTALAMRRDLWGMGSSEALQKLNFD